MNNPTPDQGDERRAFEAALTNLASPGEPSFLLDRTGDYVYWESEWNIWQAARALSAAQPVAQEAILAEVIGCFEAALTEGLQEALAETKDERLKDLVERRLMHALAAALAAPQSSQGAGAVTAGVLPLPEPATHRAHHNEGEFHSRLTAFYTADQMHTFAQEAARQAMQLAENACARIESSEWEQYKGRAANQVAEKAANPYIAGKSDGASDCIDAIRALIPQDPDHLAGVGNMVARSKQAFEDAYKCSADDPSCASDLAFFMHGYQTALDHGAASVVSESEAARSADPPPPTSGNGEGGGNG